MDSQWNACKATAILMYYCNIYAIEIEFFKYEYMLTSVVLVCFEFFINDAFAGTPFSIFMTLQLQKLLKTKRFLINLKNPSASC